MEKWFIAAASKQWLKAVVKQGERLLETHRNMNSLIFSSTTSHLEELRDLQEWIRVEEHFFAIAIGKALAWLDELGKIEPLCQQHIDDFLKKIPHAKDIRNMREHDVEYLQGKGRKQKNFTLDFNLYDGKASGSADASSTIVFNNDYLIGGRLNVAETIAFADEFYELLRYNNYFSDL
ncbi:MAG: hypothetical protein SAK29_10230 [Scytonema sp. PMC 1069.18]|nr:hypothetical protein [Scytonema sp. PMC 1069.18]MEC4884795.1 hypothetical protein [Scytonema sp. PMC 1070.18]